MSSTTIPSISGAPAASADASSTAYRVFDDRPFRGDGDVLTLAFGADGSLWSVEDPGVLRHWDTPSGRQQAWHFLSELEMLWAFGPDARWLASASDELSLWDVSTGKLLSVLPQPSWVTALAFSGASPLVATGNDDGVVRVWDRTTRQLVCECAGAKGAISAVAFSPNGAQLAAAGERKTICLWDVPSGMLRGALVGHTDRIPALAWHLDGQRLYSAGWDTTVRVWNTATGEPIILLNSHATQVTALALNADGTFLASADSAQRIHMWDTTNHRTVQVLTGFESEIRALAFGPDGYTTAAGGSDRVLHVWSRAAKSAKSAWQAISGETHQGSFDTRMEVAISPDGARLATTGESGLRVWDTATARPVLQPEDGLLASTVAFSPVGRWLAGGGADAKIRLWDAATGKIQGLLQGQDVPITSLAFAPDGSALAAAGSAGSDVWLWNVAKREPSLLIPDAVNGCTIEALAFHPRGGMLAVAGVDWLATGGGDGSVVVWDIDQRCPTATFTGGAVRLAFHPSGRILAAASLLRTVRIWDLTSGNLAHEFATGDEPLTCVAFSPDGRYLAAGTDGHALRLWDATSDRVCGALELDTQIKALCFSPDGRHLFTGNGNTSCYQIDVQRLLDSGA
jgi:WD40 repeat protein